MSEANFGSPTFREANMGARGIIVWYLGSPIVTVVAYRAGGERLEQRAAEKARECFDFEAWKAAECPPADEWHGR